MKYTNILMTPGNGQAVFEERKWQTRRLIKDVDPDVNEWKLIRGVWMGFAGCGIGRSPVSSAIWPFGRKGDRLRVREATWQWGKWEFTGKQTATGKPEKAFVPIGAHWYYVGEQTEKPTERPEDEGQWIMRPAMFMPAVACRSIVELLKDPVPERLQDISVEDAKAEGIPEYGCDARIYGIWDEQEENHIWDNRTSPENFRYLWESIHGPGSWDLNPWVWPLVFKKVSE